MPLFHNLQGELFLDFCLHIIVINTKQKQKKNKNQPLSHSPSAFSLPAQVYESQDSYSDSCGPDPFPKRVFLLEIPPLLLCFLSIRGLLSPPRVCREPYVALSILGGPPRLPYLPNNEYLLHPCWTYNLKSLMLSWLEAKPKARFDQQLNLWHSHPNPCLVRRASSLVSEREPRLWGQQTWVWISLFRSMVGTAKWLDFPVQGWNEKRCANCKITLNRKAGAWIQTKNIPVYKVHNNRALGHKCQWKTPILSVNTEACVPGYPRR